MVSDNNRRLSRKEREREAHRREILDAAERVLVRKGYHAATVEEIAQEAEFSVGTIYNFFKGKEDLYARVVEKIAGDFMEFFRREVKTRKTPEEAIGALIELRLRHFDDHRGFFRVFFETSPGSRIDPKRALPSDCARLYDSYIEDVNSIFQRGMSERSFEKMDPLYLTLCLEGIINAFVVYWTHNEPSEPLATRIKKLKAAFLSRIRGNHQAREEKAESGKQR